MKGKDKVLICFQFPSRFIIEHWTWYPLKFIGWTDNRKNVKTLAHIFQGSHRFSFPKNIYFIMWYRPLSNLWIFIFGESIEFLWKVKKVLVTLSCLTLCNPMDYSLLGSSVHGILHARILEWLTIPFSRRSSQPKDQTQISFIAGRFFTIWVTREGILFKNIYCFIYKEKSYKK